MAMRSLREPRKAVSRFSVILSFHLFKKVIDEPKRKAYLFGKPPYLVTQSITGLPFGASIMMMDLCCLVHLRSKNSRLYQKSKIKLQPTIFE